MSESLIDVYEKHKQALLAVATTKNFSAGECIFRIGEPGETAFLILAGEVIISRLVKTREKELAVVSEGVIIGEVALFSGGPRTATARTKTDVETLVFSRADLDRLRSENLPVAYDFLEGILRITADRLRSTLDRFEVVYFWLS